MRIVSIAAQTVRWPVAGATSARGRSERAAVIVEARTDRGAIGLGEAAPLPGMSLDTLDEARHEIARFARLVPFGVTDRDAAATLVAATVAVPAARFALETALFDALARERRISLASLLRAGAGTRTVPLAAVVDDPDAASDALAAGICCLKIKLGADDPLDRVFAIAAAAPGATLRIDANRTWPASEVADRLAALAALPVEYVEEPCRDAHLLLAAPLACKLALDESLAALSSSYLAAALRSPQLAAVVLKPALLGGLSACLALAALARASGVATVASHALEGPIGTAACAELALALGADAPAGTAAGLAPHPALAAWRLPIEQLAADHLRSASAPGLGFADLDLAGAVRACSGRDAPGGPP